MNHVFILWHSRELGPGETDDKLIGVYSSRERANDAIFRASKLPGFIDYAHGFSISDYVIDMDHWSEGFVIIE